MRTGVARAPGKVILAGEHFVVHGAPALALPLSAVWKEIRVTLEGVGKDEPEIQIHDSHASQVRFRSMIARALELLSVRAERIEVHVRSTLAPGVHLGSSAALSVALIRALVAAEGRKLEDAEVGEAAFELERIVHGTPSGIDNTVVALERPLRFVRGESSRTFEIRVRGSMLVADTGLSSSTAEVVAAVGRFREEHPHLFEEILARATGVVEGLEGALSRGEAEASGRAMNENQELLAAVGTSSPELEGLIDAARSAGAFGAKLTGAGGGGNMIALAGPSEVRSVSEALTSAGAVSVLELPFG